MKTKRSGARTVLLVTGAAVLLALSLVACGDGGPAAPLDPREATFHPDLGVDLDAMTQTASGLFLQDLSVGTGQVAGDGDTVSVHYRGWLPNGTLFEQTGDEPARFVLGRGRVIPGWDEGIQGMRPSGVRLLVIPPHLAYGVRGIPGLVPSNAIVVFRMELVDVDPATGHSP